MVDTNLPGLHPDERDLLGRAAAYAVEAHGTQTRKHGDIPYVSHLFAVSALVLEHGGSAVQAAAALLHDVVEDTDRTIDEVGAHFGDEVARIVEVCTDTAAGDTPGHKSPWDARKTAYVTRLASADAATALVAACDKLHNLTATVADLRRHGAAHFDRFNAAADRQLWYYRSLVDGLVGSVPAELAVELRDRVDEMQALLPGVEPWDPTPATSPHA